MEANLCAGATDALSRRPPRAANSLNFRRRGFVERIDTGVPPNEISDYVGVTLK